MIKFTNKETGEKIKRRLPTSWDQLTLAMFCRLIDVYANENNPDNFEIVSALIDVPQSFIRDASVKELDSNIFYYIHFLSDSERWDSMWNLEGKQFEVNDVKYDLIKDISEVMTLGEKEEIMNVLQDENSTTIDKAKVIFKVFYNEIDNTHLFATAATRIFPVVAFFLTKLKHSMIRGAIQSGNLQQVVSILQA